MASLRQQQAFTSACSGYRRRTPTSERELARRLGVSNGKLHYCMKALMKKGLVKLGNFAKSKHHLGYAYLLTPAGIAQKAGMTASFLKRKWPNTRRCRRKSPCCRRRWPGKAADR